jgi:hypothetical protein
MINIYEFTSVYWLVQINPLRFIRQKYGGHVGGKHASNTLAGNDILLYEFLQHGSHYVMQVQAKNIDLF